MITKNHKLQYYFLIQSIFNIGNEYNNYANAICRINRFNQCLFLAISLSVKY